MPPHLSPEIERGNCPALRNAIYKCRPGSLFVKALQRIADLLDKDRRISQFFAEYFAHGEKLSRISPRSLRALPQCRGQGIEHRHFLARFVRAASKTEPRRNGKAKHLYRSSALQLLLGGGQGKLGHTC